MKLDFEWTMRFERKSKRDAGTAEVAVIGRDYEENYGYLKIGSGYDEGGPWDVDEAWWLWRRLPCAILLAYVGLAQWHVGRARKWLGRRLRGGG